MGYVVEYREHDHEELMEKIRHAKKILAEVWEAIDKYETDNSMAAYMRDDVTTGIPRKHNS